MRVGIIIDWYLPRIGGGELYAYNLAKFLKKNGVEVRIFTLDEKNTAGFVDEFPTTRVPFGKGFKGKIEFYRALAKFLDEVDIIQAMYCHKFAAYASIYNFFRHKPFVITEQGRGILDLPENNWFYAKVHAFYRYLSINSATVFVASCREFVERAKKYIPAKRIVYIPNGVDLSTFGSQVGANPLVKKYEGKKVVLTVRRLVPKNGIQFLVEAAPYIIRAHPDVFFVLVGYGQLEAYLKERAKALGVDGYIEFAGCVENHLVPHYLDVASVVVFPSTAESTSLACLEAMAMKKAIVASAVGGYLDMIDDGKNGFLVTMVDWQDSDYDAPMDIAQERTTILAEKISLLLDDENLRQSFGQAAYDKVVRVFDWRVLIQKIIGVYCQFDAIR